LALLRSGPGRPWALLLLRLVSRMCLMRLLRIRVGRRLTGVGARGPRGVAAEVLVGKLLGQAVGSVVEGRSGLRRTSELLMRHGLSVSSTGAYVGRVWHVAGSLGGVLRIGIVHEVGLGAESSI
jgi:hypothetical protein